MCNLSIFSNESSGCYHGLIRPMKDLHSPVTLAYAARVTGGLGLYQVYQHWARGKMCFCVVKKALCFHLHQKQFSFIVFKVRCFVGGCWCSFLFYVIAIRAWHSALSLRCVWARFIVVCAKWHMVSLHYWYHSITVFVFFIMTVWLTVIHLRVTAHTVHVISWSVLWITKAENKTSSQNIHLTKSTYTFLAEQI